MFNRKIEITKENESILFINAVIENLRYAIISLDEIFKGYDVCSNYDDEYTFYFFHIQSILTAQGNIYNVLFYDYFSRRLISRERVQKVRESFGIDFARYPLIGNKRFRNSNAHFDERYYVFNGVGDMNILRADTPEEEHRRILGTPHLRTIDINKWLYYSYDARGKQIVLDLQELRTEMFEMLSQLCICDIKKEK